jgi:Trk K+ transport system NAD-binding subunit
MREKAEILNIPLHQLGGPNIPYHVVAIKRGTETIIPRGDDVIKLHDIVYFTTTRKYIPYIRKIAGKEDYADVRNVMIMGGSRIAVRTAQYVPDYMQVKIVDNDLNRCNRLTELLDDKTMIINGDGRDMDLLIEEGLKNTEAFVALTGNSETNILACLAAKRMGAELAGLKNINMWLTLAVGAVGFGGMFSVYSYVSPILTEYTHADIRIVPIALAIWGVGMVIGGLVSGWLADKSLFRTMIGILVSSALAFVLASFMMSNLYTAITALFLIGFTVIGLGGALQTHLMDIAGDAQTLAASLNHSAFNLANALGAFLGGWVLSHNMGWLAPIWVGFVLSLGGLAILLIALAYAKYSQKNESVVS